MSAINIATQQLSNWNGSANVAMFIVANGTFTSSTGNINVQGDINQIKKVVVPGAFYVNLPCTVSNNTVTIPSFTLDSTDDSPSNPNATYSAYLFDLNTNKEIAPIGTFSLQHTPNPTSWANIFNQLGY